RRLGLAQESLADGWTCRQLDRKRLDGHQSVERHFAREKDHAHPAAANFLLERVLARDCCLQRDEGLVDSHITGDGERESNANSRFFGSTSSSDSRSRTRLSAISRARSSDVVSG